MIVTDFYTNAFLSIQYNKFMTWKHSEITFFSILDNKYDTWINWKVVAALEFNKANLTHAILHELLGKTRYFFKSYNQLIVINSGIVVVIVC